MRSFRLPALLLAMLAALAACSHDNGNKAEGQQVAAASVSLYPAGIIAPADRSGALRAGIYPADAPGQCCFLAAQSLLVLDNPPGAQRAIFTFYVPSVKPLMQAKPERVSVAFDGVKTGAIDLTPGAHDVTLLIPAALQQTRRLVATLTMSIAWVPAKVGLNGDTRELSIMLLKVGYI